MAFGMISEWATAPETTPGVPPADAAAWVTNGTRHKHIQDQTNVEDLVATDIEDMRSQESILGHERRIEGLRNGSGQVQVYFTGTGVTTAAGNTVTQTAVSTLIENSMGGVHLSNSTTCAVAGTHTVSQIEVDADTAFAIGAHIAWEHPSTGLLYLRRLLTNPSGTQWTLDEDLPQAAADADIIHGTITHYVAPSVLCDSAVSGRQLSMWYKKGDDTNQIWQLTGCKLQIDSIALPRDGLPTITFTRHHANFIGPHESPPDPAWVAEPSGLAPPAVGPLNQVQLEDYGSTTHNCEPVNGLEITFGLPVLRDEVQTTCDSGMAGTNKYYLGRGETTVSFMIDPQSQYMQDWQDGTFKNFRYSNTPEAAGNGIAVSMPRAEILRTPIRALNGEISKYQVTLKGHQDTTTIGTTELARSPVYVVNY